MRRIVLSALVAIVVAVAGFAAGRPDDASAHPLGNFTINHYTRIDITSDGIALYRVLDMAEIPAFQERQKIDKNGDGAVDATESDAYVTSTAATLAAGFALEVDGEQVAFGPGSSPALTFPEGQGGLKLLRLTVTYAAPLPDGWEDGTPAIAFTDSTYADRLGWREVIIRAGPGIELAESSVPSEDISRELTAYPESLSSPLDVRAATATFRAGAGAALPTTDTDAQRAVRGNPDPALDRFTELVARDDLGFGVIAIALLAAVGFGALHALSPGHGKTIVAAYLVGSRGTARHAMLLGAVVTATHTSSVYLLGFITLYLSEYIVPETLYPWLGIVSGGLIVLMGLSLFAGRLRASGIASAAMARLRGAVTPQPSSLSFAIADAPSVHPGEASHTHDDGAHTHPHEDHASLQPSAVGASGAGQAHSHGFGPAHAHRIPGQDGEPVTVRQLVGLGVFGGMLPCPSAIVVMLSAIALHRVAFGLILIVAFSIGLAGVLTAIGFALVYARTVYAKAPFLRRVADRAGSGGVTSWAVRLFPIASAGAVVAAGIVITLRALAQHGTI